MNTDLNWAGLDPNLLTVISMQTIDIVVWGGLSLELLCQLWQKSKGGMAVVSSLRNVTELYRRNDSESPQN